MLFEVLTGKDGKVAQQFVNRMMEIELPLSINSLIIFLKFPLENEVEIFVKRREGSGPLNKFFQRHVNHQITWVIDGCRLAKWPTSHAHARHMVAMHARLGRGDGWVG